MTQPDSTQDPRRDVVPLSLLSAALDEIYALRELVAYEAGVREADLTYATYPKGRRDIARDRIQKLRCAARGQVALAIASTPYASLRAALREAGAKETLTRSAWEAEKSATGRTTPSGGSA